MTASLLILFYFLIFSVLGWGVKQILHPRTSDALKGFLGSNGALGVVIVTVLQTALIEANLRVPIWVWLVVTFLTIAFGLLLNRDSTSSQTYKNIDLQGVPWLGSRNFNGPPEFVAICAVLSIGVVTLFFGGPVFHILRGNGTDSFNYATMAVALEHLPLSVIQGADAQTLIAQNPSLGLAKTLLSARWATGGLLGWCARLSHTPAVQITFAFGFLCLVLAAGPAFLIARLIGFYPWQAAGLTVAILTGFWAQVVLDMQALSHLHALPISLLVIFLVIKIQYQPWKFWIGSGRLLLTLATCALVLAYIEFVPFIFLALSLHYLWMLVCRRARLFQVMMDSLPIFLGLALAFLISPYLLNFLTSQLQFGTTVANDWHEAYFSWLYHNPLAALWGWTHIDEGYLYTGKITSTPWWVFSGLLGLTLTCGAIIFLRGVVREQGENPARSLVAALMIAGLLQVLSLLLRHQWWAAGKAVSFVVPFLWLGTGWAVLRSPKELGLQRPTAFSRVIQVVGILWMASQIWLGIARIGIAATGSDYKGYMVHHGLYRQHDWDLHPIVEALKGFPPAPISVITEDLWLGEYISLCLGDRWPIRFATDLIDRAGNHLYSRSDSLYSRHFLVDRRMCLELQGPPAFQRMASTGALVLLDLNWDALSAPFLVAVYNPNGLERTAEGKPFFWMGGQATTLWIGAPAQGTAVLSGDWEPGPSLPEKQERTFEVLNGEDGVVEVQTVTAPTMGVTLRLHRGVNFFTFRIREQPTRSLLPNGDRRPLLLGLGNPHFQDWKPLMNKPEGK